MPDGFNAIVGRARASNGSERSARAAMAKIIKAYGKVIDGMNDLTPYAMLDVLTPAYYDSQELVPKETGDLAESGYLLITNHKKNPRVEIGYGLGGKPHYTAWVHELGYEHEDPTQRKFLEQPLLEGLPTLASELAEILRTGTSAKALTGSIATAGWNNRRGKARAARAAEARKRRRERAKKKFTWGGKRAGAGRPLGAKSKKDEVHTAVIHRATEYNQTSAKAKQMRADNERRLKELLGRK